MINFPLYDLDMSEFMSATSFNSSSEESDTRAYDLYGVIVLNISLIFRIIMEWLTVATTPLL